MHPHPAAWKNGEGLKISEKFLLGRGVAEILILVVVGGGRGLGYIVGG